MAVKVSVLLRDELNILQSCLGKKKKNAQHLQKRMFHEHPRLRDCQANPQLGLTICSSMVWKVGQGTTNSVLQHRFATSTRHQMNHAEVNTGTNWANAEIFHLMPRSVATETGYVTCRVKLPRRLAPLIYSQHLIQQETYSVVYLLTRHGGSC